MSMMYSKADLRHIAEYLIEGPIGWNLRRTSEGLPVLRVVIDRLPVAEVHSLSGLTAHHVDNSMIYN